jgi:hypothetical protein
MKEEKKLEVVLALLRDALEWPSDATEAEMQQRRKMERLLSDRVMFNAGFHKAKSTGPDDFLVGSYATETLLPILMSYTEAIQRLGLLKAEADAAKPKKKAGRKPGSIAAWHSTPGYQVVSAMIELHPEKTIASHIRWGLKEGPPWLDKKIPDATHERRLGLIRKRQEAIRERQEAREAADLKALGATILKFEKRKKKH